MPCRDELAAAARLLLRAIRVVVVDVTKNQDTVGEFGIVRHLHEVLQTWFLIVYRQLDHRIQTATAVSAEVSQHSSGCRGKVVLASVAPAKPAARFFFFFNFAVNLCAGVELAREIGFLPATLAWWTMNSQIQTCHHSHFDLVVTRERWSTTKVENTA